MNRVIVVGNGPSLLDSGKGEMIDEHEIVVRCNNWWPSAKFYRDSGSKCDIWATTFFKDIDRSLVEIPRIGVLLTVNHFPMGEDWMKSQDWLKDKCRALGIRAMRTSPSQIRLYNESMKSHRPSCGVMAAMFMLEQFKSISITGFDNFLHPDGHHYFGLDDKRPIGCPHNGRVEREWVRRRVAEGKIELV